MIDFNFLISVTLFLFGLAVGSFLNCYLYRLKEGLTIKGNSFCPRCKHKIGPEDLVPVFSYLALRGRCRHCKKKISIQYPIVELLTGIVFFLTFSFYGPVGLSGYLFLALILFIFSCLIAILVYDLKYYIIPNQLIYSAMGASLLLVAFYSFTSGDHYTLLLHLASAAISFLFFFSIYWLTKEKGIGFGDVRYAFFLGLFLGFPDFLVALFLSFTGGAIIGVILIAIGVKGRKEMIPFGPFLVAATFVTFFLGDLIIDWYINLALTL